MAALIDSITIVCVCLCVGGHGCNCVGVCGRVWVWFCGWECVGVIAW